jgi:hypothetical protein
MPDPVARRRLSVKNRLPVHSASGSGIVYQKIHRLPLTRIFAGDVPSRCVPSPV